MVISRFLQRTWDESGKKLVSAHTSHGYYYGEAIPNRLDLFNIPEKRTLDIHVNYYASGVAAAHPSRKEADQCATPDRIACLHIVREFEEGEGL